MCAQQVQESHLAPLAAAEGLWAAAGHRLVSACLGNRCALQLLRGKPGEFALLERSQIRAVSSEDDRHVAGKCLKMSEVLRCDLCCFRGIGDLTLGRLSGGPLGQHFPCYR